MRPVIRMAIPALAVLSMAAPSRVSAQDTVPVFRLFDFESMQLMSSLGAYGGTYADNNEYANDSVTYGNSLITTFPYHEHLDSNLWVPGYRDSSMSALKLGYQLGTVRLGCGAECTYGPHVGVAMQFASEELDLSTATHLTFWAKTNRPAKVNVSVGMRDTVPQPAGYSQAFTIDTAWKKYSIELKASSVFKLPEWVPARPFEVARANSINFGISKDENPDSLGNALYLDDIEIVNWVYTIPTSVNPKARDGFRNSHGVQARIAGGVAYVRIPAELAGQVGSIEALDAAGRRLGRAAFGPQVSEVGVPLGGARESGKGIYFRVVGAASRR